MRHIPQIKKLAQAIGLLLLGHSASADLSSQAEVHQDVPENQLLQSLSAITQNKHDDALSQLESLVEQQPQFKLAQLVYADMLMAKAGPVYDVAPGLASTASKPLIEEAKARWQHHSSGRSHQHLPGYLLQLADTQKNIIVIDLAESRLFLYDNVDGQPRLRHDFYVSIGKNGAEKWKEGDKKTPVGVYFVTKFLSPNTLPDFYGAGAFPINYPNHWDRRLGRTGYGIWLHGNPWKSFSRPPLASDGCVTLTNQDFDFLKPFVDVGDTPVIIANGIQWDKPEDIAQTRETLQQSLQQWMQDWQSRDSQRYLSHYARDFQSPRLDYQGWKAHKTRINSGKSYIKVQMKRLNMFTYPGKQDLAVVTFEQDYRSDTYQEVSSKRQYWKRGEDGRWRIIYEGPA